MEGPANPRASTGSTGSRGHAENIRKVAVTAESQTALFMQLNQNQPLAAIIKEIAEQWNLTNSEDYALQFSEPTRQTYITERNRGTIQNGNVLQLTDSPARAAQSIIDKLKTGRQEEKLEALKNLDIKASDSTFAIEFIQKQGLKLIIEYTLAGNKTFSGDPLMYMLRSFVSLMEHGVVSWDILEPDFTKQIAECVSGARPSTEGCIKPCLEILENLILHSTDHSRLSSIEHNITPDKVVQYLDKPNTDIQQSALAVINAMFIKSSEEQKKNLTICFQSKHFRSTIISNILGKADKPGSEMTHQLYLLQKLILNMYEERMNTKLNPNDAAQVAQVNKHIEDLRRIGFDFSDGPDANSVSNRKSAVSKDFKKLGFLNQTSPMLDFEETPPGLLALDNMVYFAQMHKEKYIKVVLENCGRANEQDCPFVQASIHLTKILCDLLKIGEDPYDDEHFFYPMFFTVDKPVEEFYTFCIQLYNRTWKEMRASKEDQSKVLSVVNEQICRALDKSRMPATFELFKTSLDRLQYPELKKIWEAERQKKDESKAQAKPILELREMITPEILVLIKRQRLRYMEGGSRFQKFDSKGGKKGRYWYWRLAPNHKSLHYDDCGDQEQPSIESLANKIQILDIKELLIGKNCPHWKSSKHKTQAELAFCLMLEGTKPDDETYLHFIANSEKEFDIWVDGISVLLNNKMASKLMKEDMETLLNMEIKLRLLETEGIPIPKDPPPIPPLPENFNFAYTIA